MALSSEDKKRLLDEARGAIAAHLEGGVSGSTPAVGELSEIGGAFVTLHKAGKLRGCVGLFESDKSLLDTVREMAVSAAVKDRRFPPLIASELVEINIEISALTPLKKIYDISEIEIGRHGIYMIKGSYRGVLLPQVATEHGFDRDEFLSETCLKAGLSSDEWRSGTVDILIFEAQVFGEE